MEYAIRTKKHENQLPNKVSSRAQKSSIPLPKLQQLQTLYQNAHLSQHPTQTRLL